MILELIYLTIPTLILVGMLFLIERLRWQVFSIQGYTPQIHYNPPQQYTSPRVATMLRFFVRKQARDKAWAQLTAKQKAEHCRHVHKNLVLHPTRIEDYEETLNGDKEYGDEIPSMNFDRIYTIEPKPPEF